MLVIFVFLEKFYKIPGNPELINFAQGDGITSFEIVRFKVH
ncbi:hypothetical protein FM107_06910 [Sphingobacterium sp. JB170]|nr:hypothetical protein FM107_06910 [Sphingobacterium sp. JB170]